MFLNLRNTSLVAFFAIIVLIVAALIYFKNIAVKDIIFKNSMQQAEVVSSSYNESIWQKYSPVINYVSTLKDIERNSITQFIAFKKESEQFYDIPNLVKVTIYDNLGGKIFDNAPNTSLAFDSEQLTNLALEESDLEFAKVEAFKGKKTFAILPEATISKSGIESAASIIAIFIPIKSTIFSQQKPVQVSGILELNIDVTEQIKTITNVQIYIFLSVLIVSLIILIVVFYSSRKAEEIMEKQQEASVEMAAAKAMAESESRAKSQFLANVSHELRTPLNAIIGFSEIINNESMGPIGNPEYKEFIKDIHTSGTHLLSLINDILDFSKAEENKLSVDFEQIDITKLVKICMRMVMPRAESANINLIDEVPSEHFVLIADPKRLKQVILNILSNAVKFTPRGGQVLLRVWKDIASNSVVIEIKDTGVGMAPQDLARSLSPFGQIDNKLSRKYEGTGLGLPLTKKLVELMRGKFDIRSEVGLGTTVLLYFPLQDGEMNEITENDSAEQQQDEEVISEPK